jgi:hypothetical protein
MSILNELTQQLSGPALQALTQQLGTDQSTTQSAVEAALPMLIGALAKNASTEQGAQSLAGALERDHDGGILNQLTGFLASPDNGSGPGILGHVLGQKQPAVEQGVSQISGLDMSKVGPLLANLAPIVMGMLAQQQRSRSLDPGSLAGMLNNERQQVQQQSSGTAGMAMTMLNSFLDKDGDGSAIDDIGGMLGNFFKK